MKMGDSVPSTVKSETLTFSIVPPSTISSEMADVPIHCPKNFSRWSLLGFTTMPLMLMLRKPPLVSVPSFTALQWLLTTQSDMRMFSQRRGEVDFRVMPSSSLSDIIPRTMTS